MGVYQALQAYASLKGQSVDEAAVDVISQHLWAQSDGVNYWDDTVKELLTLAPVESEKNRKSH